MLVSPHFKQFQCLQKNVSGFASSVLSPAGMTGSAKTAWVRSLLQKASEAICLPPERIIWCYSQWQSAYTEMLVAMLHIEFVKGIPTALEQESYLDVNKRNLIVFDDQMIDASKDKANCESLY